MRWIILLMLLISMPLTFAGEDDLEVDSFKVYDDGKQLNTDWDDDEFRIEPNTEVEIQIRFENKHNNKSVEVDVESILYDVEGDIDRSDSITINEDEKKAVVFEYFIPNDVSEGFYDIDIQYEYKYEDESTTYTVEKTFEMEVRREPVEIDDILINITQQLANERERSNTLLEDMKDFDSVALNLSECQHALGRTQITEELYESYKADYEREVNKSETCMQQKANCEGEKQNMYSQSQIDSRVETARREGLADGKKDINNNYMFFGAVALAWYFWKKKEKTVGGKGEGELEIAKGW